MNRTHLLILLTLALCALAGCGHSGREKKATAFSGGALSGFGGDNGSDSATRQVARDVMDLRTFDLISDSFTLSNGAVSTAALGGGSFGAGDGTQILGVERAAVLLDIASGAAAITDVKLSGDFDIALAQRAIDTPGAQFTAAWRLSFNRDGSARVITFVQELTGAQFVTVP